MTHRRLVERIIHWLLALVVIIYLVSGFGITEFRTVESLTFGVLTKSLAFKIHNALTIPIIILVILHICLSPIMKLSPKLKKRKQGSF